MSSAPHQPIPDKTQAHVDRLIGTRVGGYEFVSHLDESMRATLYRGHQPSLDEPVTIEVLRAGVLPNDEDAKAVKAIRCASVAEVLAFGQLEDGRHYRVLEPLEGELLTHLLERSGPMSARDLLQVLREVAAALEAAHAWALAHGDLLPSSVFIVRAAEGALGVKLLNFGMAKRGTSTQSDLRALSALGFAMMTGRELPDGARPPKADSIPDALDGLLRDLADDRLLTALEVRKDLEGIVLPGAPAPAAVAAPTPVAAPTAAAPPKRSRAPLLVVIAAAIGLVGAGTFALLQQKDTAPLAVAPVPDEPEDAQLDDPPDQPDAPETPEPGKPAVPRPPKPAKPPPSAKALTERIERLEARLHARAKPGEDLDAALFVLNKQRLRLTGTPSLEDRKDVAHQLDGWQRSYLR